MKWIALFLQLISFRSSLLESRALLDNAKAVAEKGKRAAIFSGFVLMALVYFLVGSILAVVELGLQVDRGASFHLSGLLGAALVLLLVGGVIVGVGFLSSREGTKEPPPPAKEKDVKDLLQAFALSFLAQLTEKLQEKKAKKDESGI